MTPTLTNLTDDQKLSRLAQASDWIFHSSVDNALGQALPEWWESPDGETTAWITSELPPFLTDLNAAITLCDMLAEKGWHCNLANGLDKTWECEFMRPPTESTHPDDIGSRRGETLEIIYGCGDTVCLAIVEAALIAINLATK